MSLDVQTKLAKGDKLDDDEVAYARQHAIPLPEEYGSPVAVQVDPTQTPLPVVQTGPAFEGAEQDAPDLGPGLFLTVDQLESLNKEDLKKIAEVAGFEVASGAKKDDLVAALAYGGAVEGGEDEAEPEDDEEPEPEE
jgi:hypothetical protein